MSAKLHVTAAVAVAVIFGAGFLAGRWTEARRGTTTSTATIDASLAAPVEERWSGTTLQEYRQRLNLTAAQIDSIRPLIKETSEKLATMRRDVKTELQASIKKMNERISTELTVEQRREFVALIREKQAQRDAAGK